MRRQVEAIGILPAAKATSTGNGKVYEVLFIKTLKED